MRLFRLLVPVALVAALAALVMTATTGASSTAITPAPAFTPTEEQAGAAGDDWITVGGGLNNQGHIAGLHLAWTGTFHLPTAAAAVPEEGGAIVYKGTVYMPNGLNWVQAI